ncbi:MAG: hypothetical protein AAB674_01030 [Patescibacteria group bacterium]
MNKKELTFLGIGILMLIIVISSVIFSIKFLTGSINQAMNKKTLESPGVVLKFQIEKAEALLK